MAAARGSDYCGAVGFTEYSAGDVVYFPAGPFSGVCGVVKEVDVHRATVRLELSEGVAHREGGVLRERRHTLTAAFDEIELV
ncbi:Uncharacterised protein [Nocardia asteroides]|nr:hypothetical protein SAMN05444423_1011123 [Nocardia asteroides]VEG38437.1 Uncharacterised protein [Nocardia asteroides]